MSSESNSPKVDGSSTPATPHASDKADVGPAATPSPHPAPEEAPKASAHAQVAAQAAQTGDAQPPQPQTLTFGQFIRRQFRGLLTGETPLWLIVALGLGAFLNLVTFAFLISPINRQNLLNPPVEQMQEMGMSATDIADRMAYAEEISVMMLNTGAAISLLSMLALSFSLFWRRRLGIYLYIVLTGVMLVATLINGMFTPVLLLVPTAVVVTAVVNRELLT